MTYADFLNGKRQTVPPVGFDPSGFTAPLFPFQRDIVTMACRVGRFCIWADCGMGKTAMQLEWAAQVCQYTGGNVLILAPLAVSHQTVREGHVSLEMGRRFVGFELKPSYFNCAVKNLTNVQATRQETLMEVTA